MARLELGTDGFKDKKHPFRSYGKQLPRPEPPSDLIASRSLRDENRAQSAHYRVAKSCAFTLILTPEVCVRRNVPLEFTVVGCMSGETKYVVPDWPTYATVELGS